MQVSEPPPPPPASSGREDPIECHGDDLVVLQDCVIEGDVAIDAHGNCQVTLTHCDIRGGRVAIDAHGNASVTIQGGSVTAPKAIDAHGNATVIIEGAAVSGVVDQHGNASVVTR
jgi:hypothetical protein